MKKKSLLTLVGSICLVLVLVALLIPGCAKEVLTPAPAKPAPAPAPAPKPITLKAALYHTAACPCAKVWLSWEPKFDQLTDGRVKLKVFHSGALTKGATGQLDAVQKGVADLAFEYLPLHGATIPVLDVLSMPMIWRDIKGTHEAYDVYGLNELMEEEYAAHGFDNIKIISSTQMGLMYTLTTKRQVKVPSDLKGLKIRTSGCAYGLFIAQGGGKAVRIPIGEGYEAMQKGVLDGTVATLGNISDWKWYEICRYFLESVAIGATTTVIANKKSLAKIPEDLRPLVMEFLKAIDVDMEATRSRNSFYIHDVLLPAKGVIRYTPTADELKLWEAAAKPAIDEWLKRAGPQGQKALDIVRKCNVR